MGDHISQMLHISLHILSAEGQSRQAHPLSAIRIS